MDKNKKIKIASIFTMLSMYLLFLYVDNCKLYNKDRIACMSNMIYNINKDQFGKGIFKKFPIQCYGDMATFEKILEEKQMMFNKLKNQKGSKLYNEWFLKYDPVEEHLKKSTGPNLRPASQP